MKLFVRVEETLVRKTTFFVEVPDEVAKPVVEIRKQIASGGEQVDGAVLTLYQEKVGQVQDQVGDTWYNITRGNYEDAEDVRVGILGCDRTVFDLFEGCEDPENDVNPLESWETT